jgi:hypothetical protein
MTSFSVLPHMTRRLRFGAVSAAVVVLVVLLGVLTPAAEAVEAPFFSVADLQLLEGEHQELLLAAEGNQVLENKTSKITITCTKIATVKGALILGSLVGLPSTGEGELVYSGCTVTGNGSSCKVEGEKITTSNLKDELAYEKKEEPLLLGNKFIDFFSPASGNTFATVKFTGTCTFSSTTVGGSLSAGIKNSLKESAGFEENESEEEEGFFETSSKEACKVAGGKFTECKKPSLTAFGTETTLSSEAKTLLASGAPFGVQAIPTMIIFENVSGAGEAPPGIARPVICEFSAVNEKCKIEIIARAEIKILGTRITGTRAATRYEIPSECTVGLIRKRGQDCTGEVEVKTREAGTFNDYCVKVEKQPAPGAKVWYCRILRM